MKALSKYKKKRDFESTPEPSGSTPKKSKKLRFCVQKHAARHLHYDFRLEHEGVLLSWAIPKGPSLNPKDKRLAIKVEDHPLDYQYFEGVIPKGNYGAGTVEIWDRGFYHTHDKDTEKYIKAGLKKGHFSIILEGEKLNGEFTFLKLKDDTSWLLIKKNDEAADDTKKHQDEFPSFFPPMLATLVEEPFDDDDWLFEIKWDGYRALAFIQDKEVKLLSRTNHSWKDHFPEVISELKKIKSNVVLDGEVVVLDDKGKPSFQLMQNYQKEGKGTLCYYVFDLLYKDGEDLRDTPLITRKEILQKLLPDLPHVKYCNHVQKTGKKFFKAAKEHELEGIIGKKMSSTYQSKRSHDWVKVKTSLKQEVVIGGFTDPRGSRKNFGALLVGTYNQKNELEYRGHVGGGFDEKLLDTVYKKLKTLITKKCPFKNEPRPNMPVVWVKPKLVCEVNFTEFTNDHLMRHPVFEGLRMDKPSKEIADEIPEKATLSHLEKIYWPKEGYTKGDLISYYEHIASYILPYLKDRPIMLHRYPDGIEGKDFYQKDLPASHPSWLQTCDIAQEKKTNRYLIINNQSSLLYAVNLGSIDLHPFSAKYQHLDFPEYCIIDIDPHDVSFDHVIEVALLFHELLEKIDVPHFCKTSGGKGLHILIPLHGEYTYDQARKFAEVLATLVHQKTPSFTSLERSPAKRPKKIYLDCLQNRVNQGIAAPYSVRPRPHAPVSCPLKWNELNAKLDPLNFTIKTMPARLKKLGDLLAPLLKKKANLKKALVSLKTNL